jgi:hypothetical protein
MVPFGSLEVTLMAIRFEPPLERISVPETGLVEHQPWGRNYNRRCGAVAGCRAAEGFQELSLSRTHKSLFADGLRFVLDDDVHTVR